MNPTNTGLPVSATQPTGPYIQQGLPDRPPFVPQLNVGNLQQLLPVITGCLMLDLQQNAQKNPLRMFTFNLCSANGYNNQAFIAMVQTAVEYVEMLVVGQNVAPQTAVPQVTAEVVMMFTAVCVQQYPALQQYVAQQQLPDLQALMQRFQQVKQQIEAFQRALQQQAQGGTMWGGQPGGGFIQHQNPGYGQWQPGPQQWGGQPVQHGRLPAGGGGFWQGQPGGNMGGGGVGFGMHSQPRNVGGGGLFHSGSGPVGSFDMGGGDTGFASFGMGSRKVQPSGTVEELTFDADEPGPTTKISQIESGAQRMNQGNGRSFPSAPKDNQGNLQPTQPRVNLPVQNQVPINWETPNQYVSYNAEKEYPKVLNLERPYDSLLPAEGVELRSAYTSGWTTSFDPEQPYRLIYDPATHLLFHLRRENGNVIEVLQERNESMDYLANELDPELRAKVKAATPTDTVIAPNSALVQKLKPHPKMPIATVVEPTGTEEEIVADTPKLQTPAVIENVVLAHSLDEAETRAELQLPEGLSLDSNKTPVEYYTDVLTTFKGSPNLLGTIKHLAAETTYEDFRMKLLAAKTQEQIPEELFKLIDERLTAGVNEGLHKDMGLTGWSITSFVDDIMDLRAELTKDFSKTLTETFDRHAAQVISNTVSVLGADSYAKYLKMMHLDDGTPRVIVFRERCSVTHVPWNLADALVGVQDGGLVTESAMPNLHHALQAIVTRTSADQPIRFARRYLIGLDKVRLEIRIGYFGREAILLMKA